MAPLGHFDSRSLDYAAARAFTKVAVLIRLSAMTPSPTRRINLRIRTPA
jgi:hypothetical protein